VRVEAAAFELMAQLCIGSAKGGRAVAGAEDFQNCLDRALGVVSSIVSQTPDSPADSLQDSVDDDGGGAGSNTGEQEGNADSTSGEKDTVDVVAEGKGAIRIEIDYVQLVKSAFSYLSALIPNPTVRGALLGSHKFIMAASSLVLEENFPDLQFEAVRVIAKLAPYSSLGGALSPDRVGDLLQSALATESCQHQSIRNPLHVHAAEGIQFVYDSLHESKQNSILQEVVTRYAIVLKSHSLARTIVKGNDRPNGGELAYHLTTIMMLANSKESVEQCFDWQLLTYLVNTIQWRYDPKTVISEEEICFWDGTTTQSLQILAQCLWRENARLLKAGIKMRNLKESVVMVARPGKAPRKAVDFPSALAIAMKNGEAASKLAAQRILRCLNEDN
jgi:hypothetical protein